MRRLIVTPRAGRDLAAILHYSRQNFGEEAADRYKQLIEVAYGDLLAEPDRPAARRETDLVRPLWFYHLRHVARRLAIPRVASPRHLVVYRFDAATVQIVRILHEAMNLPGQATNDA